MSMCQEEVNRKGVFRDSEERRCLIELDQGRLSGGGQGGMDPEDR